LALKQCRAESLGADGAERGNLCKYRRTGQNPYRGLRYGFRQRCTYELRVVFRQNDPGWHPTEVDWAARLPGQNLSTIRFEH